MEKLKTQTLKQKTKTRSESATVECLDENGANLLRPANSKGNGGGNFVPCISCGDRAILSNEDGNYCSDCMKIHIVEKIFGNLTKMQRKGW